LIFSGKIELDQGTLDGGERMPLKTIFADELVKQYMRQGYWGRGTFLDHFERNVDKFQEREYVVDVKERVSFSKMSKIVDNIARRLLDFDFK
jgi:non-ribosomal peptide synthetase component E (peptide arylation enzyme)